MVIITDQITKGTIHVQGWKKTQKAGKFLHTIFSKQNSKMIFLILFYSCQSNEDKPRVSQLLANSHRYMYPPTKG